MTDRDIKKLKKIQEVIAESGATCEDLISILTWYIDIRPDVLKDLLKK